MKIQLISLAFFYIQVLRLKLESKAGSCAR